MMLIGICVDVARWPVSASVGGAQVAEFKEVPTPAGIPPGRTRMPITNGGGGSLTETLYSCDRAARVCKYALIGGLDPAKDWEQDFIYKSAEGFKYDQLYVTFTVLAEGASSSKIVWEVVSGAVPSQEAMEGVLNMFCA